MYPQGDAVSFAVKVLFDCFNNWRDLVGQRAAVGIAEHQAFSPSRHCFIQRGQGIFAILFEAVEKMFCIVKEMLRHGV